MTINANSHPYRVIVGDGSSEIHANRHPIKVDVEGGVVTPAEFEELEKKVDALATDLSYKGGVPTYDDLPADPETGDVYTTEDTGILYVWDGDEWVALNDTGSSVLTGSSDPTTSTEGELGQLYLNTTSGKLFYCSATSPMTWQSLDAPIQSISVNGTAVTPDANKNVALTIPEPKAHIVTASGIRQYFSDYASNKLYEWQGVGVTPRETGVNEIAKWMTNGEEVYFYVNNINDTFYSDFDSVIYGQFAITSAYNGNSMGAGFKFITSKDTVIRCYLPSPVPTSSSLGNTQVILVVESKLPTSAFTGTDGTAAGTSGLVPAPAATDGGKFLKSDGTWQPAGGGEGVKELTSADFNGAGVVNTAQLTPGKYVLSPSIKSTYADGTPWLKIGNFDASDTEIVFGRRNSGGMGSYDMTSMVWRPFMVVDSFEINDADRVIIVNAHCLTTSISAATLLNYGIFDEMTYIFPFEDLYDPGHGDDYKYYRLKMPSVYNDSFINLESAFVYYRDNRFYDYLTLTPFAVVKKSDPTLSVFNAQHPGLVPKAPTSDRENHILYGNGVWGGWTQADYDQNDSTAKAYIQNRPFYESTSTQTTAVAAASQAFSESVEYRSWCLALNELLYAKGVINDQYNLFPYLTTSNTLPAALATALTNEDTLCLMKSQNNENFYAQWTDMGSMSDEYVYIKPVAFPAWGAAESVSGGGYTFSIQLTQAAVEYSWDNASWSPGIVVLAKFYDPEYSQDVFCMGIFTGGGSILPSGQNVMANGGRVGTYTAITTIQQLDAKYVPVDNSTITVNGSGKLVASGGPTVVQTTGTSQTNVMSQNAVTSMVYADPVTRYNVQIGYEADNASTGAVAIGYFAEVPSYAPDGVAIGARSSVGSKSAVAIGWGATAPNQGQFDISSSIGAAAGQGYNNSNYRLLTGLYDPQSAHDAVNKQYCDAHSASTITNSEFDAIFA